MPSGVELTEHEINEILRLAGLTGEDGQWLFSYQRIADALSVNARTVRRYIRQAAVRYGQCHRWRSRDRV